MIITRRNPVTGKFYETNLTVRDNPKEDAKPLFSTGRAASDIAEDERPILTQAMSYPIRRFRLSEGESGEI